MDRLEVSLGTTEVQMLTVVTHDTECVPELLTNLRFSDLYNLPGESVAMTSEISSAMRAGNKFFLETMKSYKTPMACFKNNKGDSILHVAASFGHIELVESIVSKCPSLLLEPNWKDQVPLHVAARAGQIAVVKVLVASISCFSAKLPDENRERLNLHVVEDINGDTPLHLAVKYLQEKKELLVKQSDRTHGLHPNGVMYYLRSSNISEASTLLTETAIFLASENQCVSFLANKDGISPLYLAVQTGSLSLTNAMLNRRGSSVQGESYNLASQLKGRKSLVHVALKAMNTDVLDVILNEYPSLVTERDEEGQTCLSVGASVGFYGGIWMLLNGSNSGVFECNDDGSFPIHKAVEKGHLNVINEILKRCPDSIEQLNKEDQNVFHIAAKSGKALKFLISYIKKLGTKNHLMEEQDVDGNTPLHLATIGWRPRSVDKLTKLVSTKTKLLDIQNNDGLRPLDIAQLNLRPDYIFRERMTLMVLLCIHKCKAWNWTPTNGMTLKSKSNKKVGDEKFKDRINILLVVATLVATVTFAAGFTIPGGFNGSDNKNAGMAILVNDRFLRDFLVYDTLAMHCSVIAIVALIWAQLGDPEIAHNAFHLALPFLFVALFSMSKAFSAGVRATIKMDRSLSLQTTTIFEILVLMMVILLAPYVIPQRHDIPILQSFSRFYLKALLMLVNEDDNEEKL